MNPTFKSLVNLGLASFLIAIYFFFLVLTEPAQLLDKVGDGSYPWVVHNLFLMGYPVLAGAAYFLLRWFMGLNWLDAAPCKVCGAPVSYRQRQCPICDAPARPVQRG